MFKGVAFDMDGVIIDSEKIYRKNEYRAAEHFGFPKEKVEGFCNLIAGGTREGNTKHFHEVFETDMDYDVYREYVSEGVERHAVEHGYELKPGVTELLDFLRDNGIKTALATSTDQDRAERFLEPLGVFSKFDRKIFGNQVKRGKPAPDIYIAAAEAIGLNAADVIGVEDSVNGVLSSHAAGLYTVMVIDLIPPTDKAAEAADIIYEKNSIIRIKELF